MPNVKKYDEYVIKVSVCLTPSQLKRVDAVAKQSLSSPYRSQWLRAVILAAAERESSST